MSHSQLFLYALKRNLLRLSGLEGATWCFQGHWRSTWTKNLLHFAPLLHRFIYGAPDFEELQMFMYWHHPHYCYHLLHFKQCSGRWHLLRSCCLGMWLSVWKAEHLHLKVLEGRLSLFFCFCEFLMLSIIGMRSDGHAIGSNKKRQIYRDGFPASPVLVNRFLQTRRQG